MHFFKVAFYNVGMHQHHQAQEVQERDMKPIKIKDRFEAILKEVDNSP